MKNWLLGAVLGAVVMFVWGFVFWGVLPIADSVIREPVNSPGLQSFLGSELGDTGTYIVPYSDDPGDTSYQRQHKEGPIATIHFRAEGSEPMAPGTFVLGWLHEFVVLLVMGLVLKVAALSGFGARFAVVALAGVAGSLFSQLSGPIWWLQPLDFALAQVFYETVAWLLAALVLAAVVKPGGRPDPGVM